MIGALWRAKHQVFINWAGKDTLFRWPLKSFFLWHGGVPINRRERTGMIEQLLQAFATRDRFHMCFTPEGTRSKTDHWKSGFYRLALAAKVPVGLGFIDYGHKQVGSLLFVTSNVARVPMTALVRELKPFLVAHGVILLIITFVPALSTWLPHRLGFR